MLYFSIISLLIFFILLIPLQAEEIGDNLYLTNLSFENNKGLISVKICCENKSDSTVNLKLVFEVKKIGKSGSIKTYQSQNLSIKPSENVCRLRNIFSIEKEDSYILRLFLIKDDNVIFTKEINSKDFS